MIIVAFHSALRGANLFVSGLLAILVKHNLIKKSLLPPKDSARYVFKSFDLFFV